MCSCCRRGACLSCPTLPQPQAQALPPCSRAHLCCPQGHYKVGPDPHLAELAARLPAHTTARVACCVGCPGLKQAVFTSRSLQRLGICMYSSWVAGLPGSNESVVPAGPGSNAALVNSAAFQAMQNANMPTITSVVFDGFLSDCTVSSHIVLHEIMPHASTRLRMSYKHL